LSRGSPHVWSSIEGAEARQLPNSHRPEETP
jgi:hypothetical protein